MTPKNVKILALVGAGMLALGSLMPWVTMFGVLSIAGTVGPGKFTLAAAGGVALLLLIGPQPTRLAQKIVAFVLALAGLGICVYYLAGMSNLTSGDAESDAMSEFFQIGIGLEIAAGGALLAVIAIGLQLMRRRPVPGSPLPPPVVHADLVV